MTPADELRQKALSIEDEAWAVRFTEPMHARSLKRIADELREIAFNITHPVTEEKGDPVGDHAA